MIIPTPTSSQMATGFEDREILIISIEAAKLVAAAGENNFCSLLFLKLQ
jgi:hypothetical protein